MDFRIGINVGDVLVDGPPSIQRHRIARDLGSTGEQFAFDPKRTLPD